MVFVQQVVIEELSIIFKVSIGHLGREKLSCSWKVKRDLGDVLDGVTLVWARSLLLQAFILDEPLVIWSSRVPST